MRPRTTWLIARKEIRDSVRNRWFMLYAVMFGLLSMALSYFALSGTGLYGFAGFGRTTAALVNLVLLIVPLMGLTIGAGTLASERERGTLAYLLAQPVTRAEVLIGKFLGLGIALSGALVLGFAASAAVLAAYGSATGVMGFLMLVVCSLGLGAAMLSTGVLVSAFCRRGAVAAGIGIGLWLVLVFASDLGLMGSTVAFRLDVTNLFALSLVNPIQVFKMAVFHLVSSGLDVLGPVGIYAEQTHGNRLGLFFGAALAVWVVVPLGLAQIVFSRRSIV